MVKKADVAILKVPAAERADVYPGLLAQIKANTNFDWTVQKSADGTTIFVAKGGQGGLPLDYLPVRVFDSTGNVFKGNALDRAQFEFSNDASNPLKPIYQKLQALTAESAGPVTSEAVGGP